MKIALRPGLEVVALDPGYAAGEDWRLESLADELAATGADIYAGHSWGGAVAATAAVRHPPAGLVCDRLFAEVAV
ncbi:MAG TPA: hypothetical protein VFB25_11420 [Gaiellaceae bacterium]|nr:hypothetical protein [Gaiellaceae bacterium]